MISKSLPRIALLFLATMLVAAPAHAATTQQAKTYIETLARQTVNILKNGGNKEHKEDRLAHIFQSNIDFEWVSRFVMGRYWRVAKPEQKERYTEQYKRFITYHYASLFSEYGGADFKIGSVRDDGDEEFSVGMRVKAEGSTSEPVYIDYKVRHYPNGFRIFDVMIEGVSMLTTQRSEFNAVIGSNNIDYLINALEKKADASRKH